MPTPIPFFDESALAREAFSRARVLFTDLDGTLLGLRSSLVTDSHGAPSLDAVSAIVRLNEAGLRVVTCSGRNSRQLRELSRLLDWPDFIGELGCVRGYDRGKTTIFDTGTWPEGVLEDGETPYHAIERVGAVDLLQEHFPGKIEYHVPWHMDREVTHMLRGNVPIAEAQSVLDTLPIPITIVDNGVIRPLEHELVGVTEIHAIHLVPTGVSKERALALYLDDHGIGRREAIAIGDSAADVAMAEAADTMLLVANGLADPLVRERADARTNVFATRAERGAGWAELANAWLAARGA